MTPNLNKNDALYLDFDGTLVDIAPSPADVVVSPELLQLIANLQMAFDGAVAIVSGRPIADLDKHLAPLQFVAAGEHGAEIRYWIGEQVVREQTMPESMASAVQQLADSLAGTEAEIKLASASLHYRRAPEHASAVLEGMRHLEAQLDGYALMLGKMVAELKPRNIDKGLAVRELHAHAPFAGRRAVFVGDDVTDESGFAAANALDGLSIRVGNLNDTCARYSLPDIRDVHAWLANGITAL